MGVEALLQGDQELQRQGGSLRRSRTPTGSPRRRTRARSGPPARTSSNTPSSVAQILADLHLDTTTIVAALLHDTVEDTEVSLEQLERAVRPGGHADRGRPHEARCARVPQPRAGAGRERPQDDRRDGGRHPGAADQARRPPAQHAHARGAAGREAAADRDRDARDLRAARAPAGRPADQVGAGGPVVQDAASRSRTARSRASSTSAAASGRS